MTKREALIETGHYIADIAQFSAQATVSIKLLDVIENTIKSLTSLTNILNGHNSQLQDLIEYVSNKDIVESEYIDPDDDAIVALEKSRIELKSVWESLNVKRASVYPSGGLNDHHCESLHDAYDLAILAAKSIVDSIEDMRFAIIKHDLAAEPRDIPLYDNVNSLIAELRQ